MSHDTWTKLDNKNSLVQKGTQYRNMQAWSRPCALCRQEFIAYTPGNAPADKPPTVTTCEEHRGAPNGISYGWLAWDGKNVVPGRKMKADSAAPVAADSEELAETKKLLDEAYEANADLMQQAGGVRKAIHETLGLSLLGDGITYDTVKAAINNLKARIVKYELQPQIEAKAAEPFDPHKLLAEDIAKRKAQNTDATVLPNSLPWA